jgi:Fe-S cluster biogenesis protein NfuA
MLADPSINMLLMLYGLVSPEPREQVESILAALGPYIATQGASIEVLDVDEGIVHLYLDGLKQLDADTQAQITQMIELGLKESFFGFRSMTLHEQRKLPVRAETFIPLQKIGSARKRSS